MGNYICTNDGGEGNLHYKNYTDSNAGLAIKGKNAAINQRRSAK